MYTYLYIEYRLVYNFKNERFLYFMCKIYKIKRQVSREDKKEILISEWSVSVNFGFYILFLIF